MTLKTRIAPTPSGYLHAGNAYSFLTTQKIAKETGANIFLRIDDLDDARVRPEYINDIFQTLNFLEIKWEEGPRDAEELAKKYSQKWRKPLYDAAIQKLLKSNAVFACTCSRKEPGQDSCDCRTKQLPINFANSALRLDTENMLPVSMKVLGGKEREFAFPAELKNFIIRKKDGQASYQVSSVIDDLYFGVNLIVRGEDLVASSIAQLGLARTLGFDDFNECIFFHHPLLKNAGGEKLSKSAGADSVRSFRAEGKSLQDLKSSFDDSRSISSGNAENS